MMEWNHITFYYLKISKIERKFFKRKLILTINKWE